MRPRLVKADEVLEPGALAPRSARAIHIKLKNEEASEAALLEMRDFFLEHKGRCGLFIHLGNGGGETVVQASAHIQVSDDEGVLARIKEYPPVADAWKE